VKHPYFTQVPMHLGTFYNVEMIAPLLGRVYHLQWRGKTTGNHTSSSEKEELWGSQDKTSFASLSYVSSGI